MIFAPPPQQFDSSSSQSSSETIQTLFNRIAPTYDYLNQILSLGQHRIWKRMTVKWAAPQPGAICLDVCCGSGDIARMLAHVAGPKGEVLGLDFAPEQLAIARQRTSLTRPAAPITWLEGDALDLPFEANQFDVATMGYGLRNVTNIPGALRELHRVLKPGGRAAILDMHRPNAQWLRCFQQWYLETVVVPTAEQFGLRQEYAYIHDSLSRFPTGNEQIQLAHRAGFTTVVHYPIVGGLMGMLLATKSD